MQKIGLRMLFGQQETYVANGDGAWEKHTLGVSRCLKAITNLNDGSDLYVLQYGPEGCYIDVLRYDYTERQWRQGCLFVPRNIRVEYFILQGIISEVEKQLAKGKVKRRRLGSCLSETFKDKRTVPEVTVADPDGMAAYYYDERKPLSQVMTGKNLFSEKLTAHGTVLLIGAHTGMTVAADVPVISNRGPGHYEPKAAATQGGAKPKRERTAAEQARMRMLAVMGIVALLVVAGGVALWQYHRHSAQQEAILAAQQARQDSAQQAAADSVARIQAMQESIAQAEREEQQRQIDIGKIIPVDAEAETDLKTLMQAFFGKWNTVACADLGLAYCNGGAGTLSQVREAGSDAVALGDSVVGAECRVSQLGGGMLQFSYRSKRLVSNEGAEEGVEPVYNVETYSYSYDPQTHMMTLRSHRNRQTGGAPRSAEPATEPAEASTEAAPAAATENHHNI